MKTFNESPFSNLPNYISYYYQINLIPKKISSILEIGIGNKFVSSQLRKLGKIVTTLDVDRKLKPDIIANVNAIGLKDRSFDCVICYEVLEHLPLSMFETCLNELRRISRKYLIISLPFSGFAAGLYLKLPLRGGGRIFRIPLPFFSRPEKLVKKFKIAHYWAIGEGKISRNFTRKRLKGCGFKVMKELSPVLNSHHIFWVLRKVK